jgi:hypothetical protein
VRIAGAGKIFIGRHKSFIVAGFPKTLEPSKLANLETGIYEQGIIDDYGNYS